MIIKYGYDLIYNLIYNYRYAYIIGILIPSLFLCYNELSSKHPKQYKKVKHTDNINPKSYNRVVIDKDKYKSHKIPDMIDVIVIGSGIGGLSCAAYLSKVGKRVLVLEQHTISGGCCHVFEDHGVEHETGIHYIGNIHKQKKILDLITKNPIEWCKLGANNNDVYDEIYIENRKYLFRAGEEHFIKDLSKQFPGEESNIREYIKVVKKATCNNLFFVMKIIQSAWIRKLLESYLKYWEKDYYNYVKCSATDIISSITQNKELIAVLTGQFGDYGQVPETAPFFIHAGIVNHYLEGGYFPKRGPSEITKNIIPTIEASGGRVLVGCGVERLIIKDNTVKGVVMENGDTLYADKIVSGVGLNTTFNKLIPIELVSDTTSYHVKQYQDFIKKTGSSGGFIYCFVNLEGTTEELELRDSNLWIYPNRDYEELLDEFEEDICDNPMPLFISSASAKDTSWNDRYPNKSSVIMLCMGKKEWFTQWESERCMHRNIEYKDLKDIMGKRMINEGLYKYYPKTKGKITHYEMGTPLTNQHYLGCLDGEGYGLESTSNRYSEVSYLRPQTPIHNLYLTGQDICTLGFAGALTGGLLTAHSILGYGTVLDIITNRNLITDLMKVKE